MADFCNKCSAELFGEDIVPEIDVYDIASRLSPEFYTNVLCEGCGMVAVLKDENSEIMLYFPNPDANEPVKKTLKEWEDLSLSLVLEESREYLVKIDESSCNLYTKLEFSKIKQSLSDEGVGYWATKEFRSNDDISMTPPLDSTHICWCNN